MKRLKIPDHFSQALVIIVIHPLGFDFITRDLLQAVAQPLDALASFPGEDPVCITGWWNLPEEFEITKPEGIELAAIKNLFFAVETQGHQFSIDAKQGNIIVLLIGEAYPQNGRAVDIHQPAPVTLHLEAVQPVFTPEITGFFK